jgi:hypothetical protein
MVIQSNMSPEAIVEVWEFTINIFNKFNISVLSEKTLGNLVTKNILPILLGELNHLVESNGMTCFEGG